MISENYSAIFQVLMLLLSG